MLSVYDLNKLHRADCEALGTMRRTQRCHANRFTVAFDTTDDLVDETIATKVGEYALF
jgi:hypothetical protein